MSDSVAIVSAERGSSRVHFSEAGAVPEQHRAVNGVLRGEERMASARLPEGERQAADEMGFDQQVAKSCGGGRREVDFDGLDVERCERCSDPMEIDSVARSFGSKEPGCVAHRYVAREEVAQVAMEARNLIQIDTEVRWKREIDRGEKRWKAMSDNEIAVSSSSEQRGASSVKEAVWFQRVIMVCVWLVFEVTNMFEDASRGGEDDEFAESEGAFVFNPAFPLRWKMGSVDGRIGRGDDEPDAERDEDHVCGLRELRQQWLKRCFCYAESLVERDAGSCEQTAHSGALQDERGSSDVEKVGALSG